MILKRRRVEVDEIMPRRGSAYVSPVMSSSSSSSEGEHASVGRRRSQWRRRPQALSSSSSSSASSNSSNDDDDSDDSDALEDFVDRRSSRRSNTSAVQLDRLRRIFLNKPPKATSRRKPKGSVHRDEAQSTTTSNSSGENVVLDMPKTEGDAAKISLPIDHHVASLRDQVQRLARHHDAHAQQWQTMLAQAIDELTFVKQREERALQGHVKLLQEGYALRLEMFEQQYRAKVAEIRDAMRAEIEEQRAQSESAVVAAAQRLQQQTQSLFQSEDDPPTLSVTLPQADKPVLLLAKTSAFLDRQRAREDARRLRRKAETPPIKPPAPDVAALSPVARQRAKLRALEQKLASFSPATVDRVLRSVEQQRCRGPSGVETNTAPTKEGPIELQPTPLSPRRRRASCWHNGISREDRQGKELDPPARLPCQPLLSRRFLLPEEEQELLALRNSIGLAKDWMDKHALR